jgi:hypothetical protein
MMSAILMAPNLAKGDFLKSPHPDVNKDGVLATGRPYSDQDWSCWAAAAANLLAAAGMRNGDAHSLYTDIMPTPSVGDDGKIHIPGGWIDAGLQQWISNHRNEIPNDVKLSIRYAGNKSGGNTLVPWTSPNVSLYIGNNLRKPNRFVGLHIAIPATATHSLFRHAITVWGDNGENASSIALNPSSIVVADSDYNRDNVGTNGPLQSYTYLQSDHSFHPWTLNYHGRQPVIEGVVILQRVREKPNTGVPGVTMIIDSSGLATGASLDPATIRSVVGSYRLRQHGLANAIGLHYYTSSDSVVYLPDDDPEWKHTRINQSTDFHGFIGDNR